MTVSVKKVKSPGLHWEETHHQIMASTCSTQHLVGQRKVVRGLETAVEQEITGLSVPSRLRGRCSIFKDVYSDRAMDTNCFGRIPSI